MFSCSCCSFFPVTISFSPILPIKLTIHFQICWHWSLTSLIAYSASVLTSVSMTNRVDHKDWRSTSDLRSAQSRFWMHNVSLETPGKGERRIAIHDWAHELSIRAFIYYLLAKWHWYQNWGLWRIRKVYFQLWPYSSPLPTFAYPNRWLLILLQLKFVLHCCLQCRCTFQCVYDQLNWSSTWKFFHQFEMCLGQVLNEQCHLADSM